ncbi:MAG: protease modulator HflC [Hyphomicrobiales bacterium]|nr:protease modulator HflC [Hyphomicrobiales bacterium]
MKTGIFGALVVLIAAAAFALYSAAYVVYPTQQALVLQFGEVKRPVVEPGLYFKIPFVQNVVMIDKRILDLDTPPQEVIASDQKRLVVDAFARYRIANPVLFYQAVNRGSLIEANSRLSTFLSSALRAVLADASFVAVVRDKRPELMDEISKRVGLRAAGIGIEMVDVRIRRADLPEANSQAIYKRMETERQREATEIRAQGEEAARRIRAEANRAATVIIAEANRESEQIRGDGDGERNAIFAEAFTQDPDFFAFYRSMLAYEKGLQSSDTRMVLTPDSTFFEYFNNPDGGLRPGGTVPARQPALDVPPPPFAEGEGAAGSGQ